MSADQYNWIYRLAPGDEVFWTDPDEGKCSRVYKIAVIQIDGDIVTILEANGSMLECFLQELSQVYEKI